MDHEFKPHDIAIVISPVDYEDDWQGDVNISLAIAQDSPVPAEVQAHIINLATMMSTFLDVASDNPALYDMVADRRNALMELDQDDQEEGLDVAQEGNVFTWNKWSKTEGNA